MSTLYGHPIIMDAAPLGVVSSSGVPQLAILQQLQEIVDPATFCTLIISHKVRKLTQVRPHELPGEE